MIFNLDDNEQIADILIADGFDPGTIFTVIYSLYQSTPFCNTTGHRGAHFYNKTTISGLKNRKKSKWKWSLKVLQICFYIKHLKILFE